VLPVTSKSTTLAMLIFTAPSLQNSRASMTTTALFTTITPSTSVEEGTAKPPNAPATAQALDGKLTTPGQKFNSQMVKIHWPSHQDRMDITLWFSMIGSTSSAEEKNQPTLLPSILVSPSQIDQSSYLYVTWTTREYIHAPPG